MSSSFFTNFHYVIACHEKAKAIDDPCAWIPWILWRIWKNSNSVVFKGLDFDAQITISKAKEDAMEWDERNRIANVSLQRNTDNEERKSWKPPPVEWLKCNTNASWLLVEERCGIGWILRDEFGNFKWMGAWTIPKVKSALEAEAEALCWALRMMVSLGYQKLILETDSLNLAKSVNQETTFSQLAPIIQDIRSMLTQIPEVKVVFYHREGNEAANRIAKKSISSSIRPCLLKRPMKVS
ncbi:uncharacterized protein LOC112088855 [Eutrema salsugineum]|uniref:uncharacterized protein LOC112088855 n=1 Tax=Eutrema salsugineum TaxID=72664 RepID=UPI000CED04A4|nr:uncharacterized protein LOC112088855 [Eutrema salsugineum]